MNDLVRARDLQVSYPSGAAGLDGLALDQRAGEVTLVLGASGSGKSTLVRRLCGLVPDVFPARVAGTLELAAGSRVSALLQNLTAQTFTSRVEQEVAFGPENLGLAVDVVRDRTERALAQMDLLPLRRRELDTLSTGQLQRALVAALLAMAPAVVAFDEPTANLDAAGRLAFFELVTQLKSRGRHAILLVEHRTDEALAVADRIVVLDRGRVVAELEASDSQEVRAVLRAHGIRTPGELPWKLEPRPMSEFVLTVQSLCVGYGSHVALDHVSLEVRAGEVVAITGPNGAGKTTLARCAVGLLRPKSGSVCVDGQRPDRVPVSRRPALVGMVTQNPEQQLFTHRVAGEVRFGEADPGKAEADRWLDRFGLLPLRDRHPFALSQGEQQRLVLAAVAARRPHLLILDEPTSALDGRNLRNLGLAIDELRRTGTAILLMTHDSAFARAVADRVVGMEAGRIVSDSATPRATQDASSRARASSGSR